MIGYNYWTEKEIKLLKKHYKTKTDKELEKIVNHPEGSIAHMRFDLGLKKGSSRQRKQWKRYELKFIRDNYRNLTDKEMADELGCSKYSVEAKRRDMKLLHRGNYQGMPRTNHMLQDLLMRQRKAGFLEAGK